MIDRALLAIILGVLVVIALVFLGILEPVRGEPRVTEATYNVWYRNQQVSSDLGQAMAMASVIRLQEVSTPVVRAGVRQALASHPRWRWTVRARGLPNLVLWDSHVWRSVRPARWLSTHQGYAGITPRRWLEWKLLRHRATGLLVTIANTHAIHAYCRNQKPAQQPLRDRLARTHWRTVAAWTRAQQARFPGRPILLGGDFNCSLETSAPAYPAPWLLPLYRRDRAPGAIDRLITLRGSGLVELARWRTGLNSDHALHLRRLGLH